MATTESGNPTTLELTEVETTLRQLLLDVAAFIDETNIPKPADGGPTLPEEIAKEKIVLRFTGGWVRDKLLGVGSQDIDVAINKMTGYQFGLKLKEYLELPGNPEKYGLISTKEQQKKSNRDGKGRQVAPGLYKIEANPEKSKHLETVTTKILGLDIDLVNLRKEVYLEDSRNPQMEFGTPEEDAMRRDATVNAMFYNLNTCKIEDFTGRGFEDMQLKVIRTPLEPYQTFKDDPLRVLRLIRFASRLGYSIDPETEQVMGHKDIQEALKIKISRERVGIETEKMLKGPDPHMALSLIHRLGLYETVFTDPTREIEYSPDIEFLKTTYDFVAELDSVPEVSNILVRNAEEKYLAWISAAVMPWADAPLLPPPKPLGRPQYITGLVAREGLKAPNKISDVVVASLRNAEDIRKIKDDCYTFIKYPHRKQTGEHVAAADTLGMAIRRWGPSWRSQVLFSLLYEICTGAISRGTTLESYTTFLKRLADLEILEAYNFKHLLSGSELAKALDLKPGPWMKDALDVVMAWQLCHPEITDPAGAIEAVKVSKDQTKKESYSGGEKKSELPSRLVAHFLRHTIRPLFSSSQKQAHPNLTLAGHKLEPRDQKPKLPDDTSAALWKDPKNEYAVGLLRWVLSVLDSKGVEANWGLLVPPILKMMDDIDTKWKAIGCELLTALLRSTPPELLSRTGLGNVFKETLFPFFTYLPSLTPEADSITLLDKTFAALIALSDVVFPDGNHRLNFDKKKISNPLDAYDATLEKFMDKILREGVLAALFHAQPSEYPSLATTVLSHIPSLLQKMRLNCVKHLQSLIPLLSNILANPHGPAYCSLLLIAAQSMQTLILNSWPRIHRYRGDIIRGLSICWIRVCEEIEGKRIKQGDKRLAELEKVKKELKGATKILDAVFVDGEAAGLDDVNWEAERAEIVGANEALRELLPSGFRDRVGVVDRR
jgi:hypothetical protein